MGLKVDNLPQSDPNANAPLNPVKPSKGQIFKSILGAAGKGAMNMLVPGLGSAIGGGISSQLFASQMPGLGSDVGQYLAMQQQLQQEQVSFETVSTVLKIRADSSMSAIRNMVLK
jgi:hypothetical protein